MQIRLPARIGAFACLGVAITMGVLALRDPPPATQTAATASTDLPTDPLQDKVRSCQLAGQAAGSDPGCLAAWAENRRRFLGDDHRRVSATPIPPSQTPVIANTASDPIPEEQ